MECLRWPPTVEMAGAGTSTPKCRSPCRAFDQKNGLNTLRLARQISISFSQQNGKAKTIEKTSCLFMVDLGRIGADTRVILVKFRPLDR
uniref:Uncharacterized protein n=1 Tax=Romanomermis culicivorax TaxID=13658 RepID=A0A915KKF6_ROMCU